MKTDTSGGIPIHGRNQSKMIFKVQPQPFCNSNKTYHWADSLGPTFKWFSPDTLDENIFKNKGEIELKFSLTPRRKQAQRQKCFYSTTILLF